MSLTTAAVTFGLIFVAELPDKTMIATIVLSSRHRPLPVFVGASTAMVVNAAIAVAAGRLLELLPHRAVDAVVAGLFAAGAVYLLVTREETAQREGEAEAEKAASARRIALTTLAIIVVAETGDITQLLTANLVARYHDVLSVFVGSAVALVAVMGLGVLGGRVLLRVLPLATIRRVAGVALVGFAAYSAVSAAGA
ncbi:MAG TPA: TMEM165/GDT1 family protein [Acidimicrobiales bacterium]|nr:TMEM165/GDT1 family protein [Acidimicrobiales bacterium]